MKWLLALALALASVPTLAADPYFLRPLTTQAFPYDGTSRPITSAFGPNTTYVRFTCSTSCFVALDPNPFASTTTGMYIPADTVQTISGGRGEKLAVIRSTNSGTIYVTEMTR